MKLSSSSFLNREAMALMALVTLALLVQVNTKSVTINNNQPRRDVNGDILRVQDGCLTRFNDGLYYLYGARYQCCPVSEQGSCYQWCGWYNQTFAVYTSPDLETWTLASNDIFPTMTTPGPLDNQHQVYFEPCVMYNRKHDHYVLWMNRPFVKATAVSKSPLGPFTLVTWEIPNMQGSDIYFWQDSQNPDDMYVKHNVDGSPTGDINSHQVTKLSDDWLDLNTSAASNLMYPPLSPVPPQFDGAWPNCTEGGGVFEDPVSHRWYVMFGACCCFCHAGSNGYLFVSENGPLGPYVYQNDIIGFTKENKQYNAKSQQFSVAQIPSADGKSFTPVYIGQRFGSADDGQKCHDYQYWHPISIDPKTGIVANIEWKDNFTLDILVNKDTDDEVVVRQE